MCIIFFVLVYILLPHVVVVFLFFSPSHLVMIVCGQTKQNKPCSKTLDDSLQHLGGTFFRLLDKMYLPQGAEASHFNSRVFPYFDL